jgi:YfiH family protein
VIRVSLFEELSWLEHGFGTADAAAWPQPLATVRQIHSVDVVEANEPGDHGPGDALVTGAAGLWVAVKTADCVPILLADPEQRVVAAVHAGWRGSAEAIVIRTLEYMVGEFGTKPDSLCAAIGPAIGVCCYEVGPEVLDRFRRWFPETGLGGKLTAKGHLDLHEANERQLRSMGVRRIERTPYCTYCDPVRFHSFRRDPEKAGRMWSAIRVVEGMPGRKRETARRVKADRSGFVPRA